jgi:hypothetical protein
MSTEEPRMQKIEFIEDLFLYAENILLGRGAIIKQS